MKAIIDGKRYDTDTAEEIAYFDNGLPASDFSEMHETLYRTVKGAFFLCGGGGPMTKYAEAAAGGGWIGGGHITPLTKEETKQWLERHNEVDTLEILFENAIEDA